MRNASWPRQGMSMQLQGMSEKYWGLRLITAAIAPVALPVALAAIALVALATGVRAQVVDWSGPKLPTAAPAEIAGTYNRGCIGGSVALPLDGPGYEVMRISRNRYYGHPELVQFIETIAAELATEGHPGLLIGDLGQPRGGPMNSGHRSHQIGLDVDIWFLLKPAGGLNAAAREALPAPSLVIPGGGSVTADWSEAQTQALRTAALAPEVDRIFVNAAIKRHLCDTENGDRSWLNRIRPWWGHDDHFHVRLVCPADQPLCEPQAPLPPGDGCDASLDWWFSAEAAAEAAKPAKVPPRALSLDDMPPACRSIYYGE